MQESIESIGLRPLLRKKIESSLRAFKALNTVLISMCLGSSLIFFSKKLYVIAFLFNGELLNVDSIFTMNKSLKYGKWKKKTDKNFFTCP